MATTGGGATAAAPDLLNRLPGLLFLRRTRTLVARPFGRALAAAIALAYALGAMLVSGSLELGPTAVTSTSVEVLRNTNGTDWWDYPALVAIGPHFLLVVPFFGGVAMAVVSIGVGLGMAAGVLVSIELVRRRRSVPAGSGAASSLAGLTPGLIVLLTLGACCSTSAAALAGLGAIAQSSGSPLENVLLNSWYVSLFQVGVLYVALVAQEQLLRFYSGLLRGPSAYIDRPTVDRPWTPGRAAGVALRILLIVGGTLWLLAGLLELGGSPPPGALPSVLLVGTLLQHFGLGLIALAAGLVPADLLRMRLPIGSSRPLRGLTAVVGVSVAVGTPPPLAGGGAPGLVNVVLGLLRVPASWGGSAPVAGEAPGALLAWSVLYAAVALLVTVLAIAPGRTLRQLGADTGVASPEPAPDRVASPEPIARDDGIAG